MLNNPKKISPETQSAEKGFTLIELSVVVFLIGLMLLIAVPRVRDTMLGGDLETVANHLTSKARELRSDAVRNQVDHVLHLDLDNNLIWTYSADMTPEARNNMKNLAFKLPGEVKILDIYFSEEKKITDGDTTVRFSRKNYTQPATIHLAEKDRRLTLVFEPFLSYVKTYDAYVDFQDQMSDR